MWLSIVFFQESDNLWWDAFATEFFEDDAVLVLAFCLEDGPKRYSKIVVRRSCEDFQNNLGNILLVL